MHIAVALVHDRQGRIFLVRKRGTAAFMQPGGKIEAGELPLGALHRELREELAIEPEPSAIRFLASAEADAANEPGVTLKAEIFALRVDSRLSVGAELAEGRWIFPEEAGEFELAPLTRDHILPLARMLRCELVPTAAKRAAG